MRTDAVVIAIGRFMDIRHLAVKRWCADSVLVLCIGSTIDNLLFNESNKFI